MTDSILRSYWALSHTTTVPFPAPPEELLLDAFTGATAAYSFRKLSSTYAGSAVRIRRSSDDAEANIGFSGNDFDSAAAAAHIGGGSGFITTMYDQSGNGIDIINATVANQPTYSATGLAGLPTGDYDGGGDRLRNLTIPASSYFTTTTKHVVCVFRMDIISSDSVLLNNGGVFVDNVGVLGLTPRGSTTLTAWSDAGAADRTIAAATSYIGEYVHTGGNLACSVNNGADGTGTDAATSDLSGLIVFGGNFNSSGFLDGKISEMVFFNTVQTRPDLVTAINSYYEIF